MTWVAFAVVALYAGFCVAVPAAILIDGGSIFHALAALGFLASVAWRGLTLLANWPPWRR
jgi:hypothetical protein